MSTERVTTLGAPAHLGTLKHTHTQGVVMANAETKLHTVAQGDMDVALSVLKAEIEDHRRTMKDPTQRASVRAIAKARAHTLNRVRSALRMNYSQLTH